MAENSTEPNTNTSADDEGDVVRRGNGEPDVIEFDLPDSIYRNILKELECTEADSTDGRRHKRRTLSKPIPILCRLLNHLGGSVWFHARYHNISDGGLGFLCGRLIEPGTECVATFPPHSPEAQSFPGKVRHCRQVRPGIYLVGMEFDTMAGH